MPFGITKRVGTLAGREQLGATEDFIVDADAEQRFFAQRRDDRKRVVVEGGADELDGDFEHGDAVAVGFEIWSGPITNLESKDFYVDVK